MVANPRHRFRPNCVLPQPHPGSLRGVICLNELLILWLLVFDVLKASVAGLFSEVTVELLDVP